MLSIKFDGFLDRICAIENNEPLQKVWSKSSKIVSHRTFYVIIISHTQWTRIFIQKNHLIMIDIPALMVKMKDNKKKNINIIITLHS